MNRATKLLATLFLMGAWSACNGESSTTSPPPATPAAAAKPASTTPTSADFPPDGRWVRAPVQRLPAKGEIPPSASSSAPPPAGGNAGPSDSPILTENLQRALRPHFTDIRGCYEQGLTRSGKFSGHMSVKFMIAPSGQVLSPSSEESNIPDAEVVRCVLQVFSTVTFPVFKGQAVTVVYPLEFTPEQ